MVLNTNPSYPYAGTFVLKLHRDAVPERGRLLGSLEHVASGLQFQFNSGEELIERLVSGAAFVEAMVRGDEE
jgi:hypothetical protein